MADNSEKEVFEKLKKLEECLNDIQKIRNEINLSDEVFASLYDYSKETGQSKLKEDYLKYLK